MLKELETLAKEYEYGKHEHIDSTQIHIHPRKKELELANYLRWDVDGCTGICTELAYSAYFRIQKEHPDLFPLLVGGFDPEYFFRGAMSGPHTFVVVSENPLFKYTTVGDFYSYDFLKKINPWVVDPSFGTVQRYLKAGYSVTEIEENPAQFAEWNITDVVLSKGFESVLGLLDEGKVVLMHTNFSSKDILRTRVVTHEIHFDGSSEAYLDKYGGLNPRVDKVLSVIGRRTDAYMANIGTTKL